MPLVDRQKKENFEIKYHNLFGRGKVTKKAVLRKIECDLLNEIGASFDATEIVFTVNRPGKTETVEVDGIKLCIDTDITATEDNERSIMIRATIRSVHTRNIVVVLNAALQDGVERQILPCTEHHQLLCVSEKPQTTKKIAIMESITQRVYSMFMIGFCSLTVKIRLYRVPLELQSVEDDDCLNLPSHTSIDKDDDSLPTSLESPSIDEDDDVVFVVEETPVPLRRSVLSRCSKFLSAYSQSSMVESQAGAFPIQDCSLSEFSSLLSVSENEREIDEDNLDSMLELADRFIMPQILAKCELYLATSSSYCAAELLYLADRYMLNLLALFVMNQLHTEDQLISLMEFDGFEMMSGSMKAVVWKRFHTLTEGTI